MFKRGKWVAVIQGDHWIVAKISRRRGKIAVLQCAEFDGNSVDLIPLNSEVVGAAPVLENSSQMSLGYAQGLKQWLKQHKVPLKALKITISCPGVITRMITLPIISSKYLNKLLTDEVSQYFTLNIEDYVVDYRVVDHFEEDGQKRQRVLLAALPKYQWEPQWSFWQEIGLRPKVVDLSADSLARLYGKLIDMRTMGSSNNNALLSPEDIAVVDLGWERVEFVLLEKGLFFLYSDMEISLAEAGEFAVEYLSQSQPSQEEWLRTEIENAVLPILRNLEEFINFFAARHFGKRIDRIYITGEYADLPYLEDIFRVNLEVETTVGFPGGWQPRFGRKAGNCQKGWMKYGSLYGLALRED